MQYTHARSRMSLSVCACDTCLRSVIDPTTAELLVAGWEAAGPASFPVRQAIFSVLGEDQVAVQQSLLSKRAEFSSMAWARVYDRLC